MTPTLILLPGLDGTGLLFQGLQAHLPGWRTRVISYPADPALGYCELQEYVRAQLPAGPIVLLGESFSGPIAIALAAQHPDVRAVILCCTFARRPRRLPSSVAATARLRWGQSIALRLALVPFGSRALVAQLDAVLRQVPPNVLERRLREVLYIDVSSELERVNVPVLALRASHDWLVPRQPFRHQVEIPGPHFLLQHAPQQAASTLVLG